MKKLMVISGLACTWLSACHPAASQQPKSALDTVNIDHSQVKWQSIGNCWAYAFASWAESMRRTWTQGAETLNISESYISMLHFRSQISRQAKYPSGFEKFEIQTGGRFETAAQLTEDYGFLLENEFLAGEENSTYSYKQAQAVELLKTAAMTNRLKALNALSDSEREIAIDSIMEDLFGFKFADIRPLIRPASSLILGTKRSGEELNIVQMASEWQALNWPSLYLEQGEKASPAQESWLKASQKRILKRVKRALNAKKPVIFDWFLDFNALDNQGVFSLKNLEERGIGKQGYHSVVIEDYTSEGVDPSTGLSFVTGEGEVSAEDQERALAYGNITALIIKNSWGGLERTNRASYVVDGLGGYHKLEADFLFSTIAKVEGGKEKVITRFILPKGF